MSDEFEIGAMASLGGAAGAAPSETADVAEDANVCANCETPIRSEYCANCGQLAADFQRPVLGLIKDSLADSLSLDGRIARTLPALMLRPGVVTRAYLEGKRARYVPPFRLFLLASLLFFTSLFAFSDRMGWMDGFHIVKTDSGGFEVLFGESPGDGSDGEEMTSDELRELIEQDVEATDGSAMDTQEISNLLTNILEDQKLIIRSIQQWAPRFSLLLVPTLVFSLTLLYIWRRKIYVYDHIIVSLHFQSWLYIGGTVVILLSLLIGGHAAWLLFLIPVYLYRLLRETYRSGRFMTASRVFGLTIGLLVTLIILSVGAVIAGYYYA